MRFATAALFAAALLAACGSSDKKETPLDLAACFPASGDIAGWTRSGSVQVGEGNSGATGLVNGSADPFFADGLTRLGMAGYTNGTVTLSWVRVWQMGSASAAQAVWSHLLSNSLYSSNTWVDCSSAVGEACRVANTGGHWWINTRRGGFHVEAYVSPVDASSQAAALSFLTAFLARLP